MDLLAVYFMTCQPPKGRGLPAYMAPNKLFNINLPFFPIINS